VIAEDRLGRPRMHLRCTHSTNDVARELALGGAPHGTLVTAAEQTAGRGRQGRRWSAPAGSALLMSLILRSQAPVRVPPTPVGTGSDRPPWPALLPLRAAVAVCDVIGREARVKWPNDVVLERRPGLAKLAGILTEGRPQEGWAVLGIGVNVAVRLEELPAELRRSAASLEQSPAAIEPLLERLLLALELRLGEPADATLEAWRERDALRGREVRWSRGRGRAEGIDASGNLVVMSAGGERTALGAGEVHLERPSTSGHVPARIPPQG
jgi:BirA family biotin operon repressor/biotin-[acetyl-CoA-carboxylase] ligase